MLVAGGRDYSNSLLVTRVLNELHWRYCIEEIITGGALGADALAARWCREMMDGMVRVATFPADWAAHGRSAGPIRNQQMLNESKPDMVLLFPGGKGTADMRRRAEAERRKRKMMLLVVSKKGIYEASQ